MGNFVYYENLDDYEKTYKKSLQYDKLRKENKELQDRIDKAIEYNKKVLTWTTNEEITDEIANENINILKGGENE